MKYLKSLEHIKCLAIDPTYVLSDIINDENHPAYASVIEDINSIDPDELSLYCEIHDVDFFIGRAKDKNLARREWFLADQLRRYIAIERKECLTTFKEGRRLPYNEEDLRGLELDKNELTDLRNFDISDFGLSTDKKVYQICPSTSAYNSSYWLTNLLMSIVRKDNRKVMVRVDPLMKEEKETYQHMFHRMTVYGTRLDWDRLKKIQTDEFGQWVNERQTGDFCITDYVWHPDGDEVHFTCEELPTKEFYEVRGSRYFHAIFNRKTGIVDHCDGAIRFFDKDELDFRLQFHVKAPEVRKLGKRVKIFQLDKNIDQQLFMNLAIAFLVWNDDAVRYFN